MSHSNVMSSIIQQCLIAMTICTTIPVMASGHREQTHFTAIESPIIPKSVTLCDEKVNLDRIDMYERFDRELTSMAYTHGNTLLTIKRANRIFPILAPILKRNGIPSDMIYIACIESNLDPIAVSYAKAGGLWQFMPATAREYGLEVNDNVDERFHIVKATEAACKYFKNAYNKFNNWESVAASYNGGMGRISTELSSQSVSSAYDLYLTSETSRYMFRLLAMKCIMEHPEYFGFRLTAKQLYQPIEYDEITVTGAVENWAEWAIEHGIDYMTLRNHNPWIRSKSLPENSNKTYTVLIPRRESLFRSSAETKIYNHNWITK